MAAKKNPLNLNPLQLKTLTLLQELARHEEVARKDEATGETHIFEIPQPHGNHFHVGSRVVMSADATGLHNPAVYVVLTRKGLAAQRPGAAVSLTEAGLAYETGLRDKILLGSDH